MGLEDTGPEAAGESEICSTDPQLYTLLDGNAVCYLRFLPSSPPVRPALGFPATEGEERNLLNHGAEAASVSAKR
jgi:hypothetical protein